MKQILLILAIVFIFSGVQAQQEFTLGWNTENEAFSQEPQLKIYPNPCVNQKLTVELNNEELEEVRITNITGKIVLIRKFAIPVNKVELALDNIPDGIYLVRIKTSEQNILAQKLIVSGK